MFKKNKLYITSYFCGFFLLPTSDVNVVCNEGWIVHAFWTRGKHVQVVMEDDINVTHPAELLDALCDLATRGDWEFVQFQSDNAATDPHPPLVEIGNVATTAPTMKRGMGFNTGMYAVTPWAAERLLDSLNNGTHKQLDDLDGVLRTTIRKAFHFWPPLANQTDIGRGSSDVQIRGQSHTQEPMRPSCKIKKC